ncbi:MAG: hypothetical protein COT28_03540 [Methylobacterium sp. CG08_land_8_20_14_0_20_71_15]|nr:MAG: hypothetical protein COT56_02290 [Methylobacterium sp. CG09_land_8_20_14_0_10_71_15]PIU15682.1 MAG: hypothetical protein COT28_03540 [Methylobacterium sp. CG08_land_8_20_14_0_20_71_15]
MLADYSPNLLAEQVERADAALAGAGADRVAGAGDLVPMVVAALAEGAQVLVAVVNDVLIHVRDGQDDDRSRVRMGLAVLRPAARVLRRALAAVAGAREDGGADLAAPLDGPDRSARVEHQLLGGDRHQPRASRRRRRQAR